MTETDSIVAAIEQPGQTFQGLVKSLNTQPWHIFNELQEHHPHLIETVLDMQRQSLDSQSDIMNRRLSGVRRAATKAALDPKLPAVDNAARLMVAYGQHEAGSMAFCPGWTMAMQHVLLEYGCRTPTSNSFRTLRVKLIAQGKARNNKWRLPPPQFEWLTEQATLV